VGAVAPGAALVVAGWSAPVLRVTSEPVFDHRRRTWVGRGPDGPTWLSEANAGDTGATVDAVRRLLGRSMSPQRFDRLAATATAELPVIAVWGPRALDLSNPGMSLGGLIVPSPMTYEGLSPADVARATLENVAFAIRECLDLLDEVCGPTQALLGLTGGMGASEVFASLLATVTHRSIVKHEASSTAVGSAIVAASSGNPFSAAVDRRLTGKLVEADRSHAAEAEERYERWLTVRDALDQLAERT